MCHKFFFKIVTLNKVQRETNKRMAGVRYFEPNEGRKGWECVKRNWMR